MLAETETLGIASEKPDKAMVFPTTIALLPATCVNIAVVELVATLDETDTSITVSVISIDVVAHSSPLEPW